MFISNSIMEAINEEMIQIRETPANGKPYKIAAYYRDRLIASVEMRPSAISFNHEALRASIRREAVKRLSAQT